MNKLRSCIAAIPLLVTIAGFPLSASAQDGPPGPFATTTTLSISGKPARGTTITLTASVSGDQFVYYGNGGVCNAYQPNSIEIYNGDTLIGSTQLTTSNATAKVTEAMVLVNTYACQYNDAYWTTATSYTTTYQIPKNVPNVNLRAVFVPANSSYSLASQSSISTYRFAGAMPAIIDLLLKN